MKYLILVSLLVCAGCATIPPDFYPKAGDLHTITYKDNKGKDQTVFDLSGKWEVGYDTIVIIKQTGNEFEGYRTRGGHFASSGSLAISGEIDGNIIKCYTHWYFVGGAPAPNKTTYLESRLSKKVDSFECVGGTDVTGRAINIYKRIE